MKMGLVRFTIKATLAGGLVYYTVQEGLWGKPEQSIQLYGKIYNKVAPYVKENIPKEVAKELPELPSTGDISFLVKAAWNKGVITTFKFLSELPEHTSNGIDAIKSSKAIQDALNSFDAPVETKTQ